LEQLSPEQEDYLLEEAREKELSKKHGEECSKCGTRYTGNDCPGCKEQLENCTNCGRKVEGFCPLCGVPLCESCPPCSCNP